MIRQLSYVMTVPSPVYVSMVRNPGKQNWTINDQASLSTLRMNARNAALIPKTLHNVRLLLSFPSVALSAKFLDAHGIPRCGFWDTSTIVPTYIKDVTAISSTTNTLSLTMVIFPYMGISEIAKDDISAVIAQDPVAAIASFNHGDDDTFYGNLSTAERSAYRDRVLSLSGTAVADQFRQKWKFDDAAARKETKARVRSALSSASSRASGILDGFYKVDSIMTKVETYASVSSGAEMAELAAIDTIHVVEGRLISQTVAELMAALVAPEYVIALLVIMITSLITSAIHDVTDQAKDNIKTMVSKGSGSSQSVRRFNGDESGPTLNITDPDQLIKLIKE